MKISLISAVDNNWGIGINGHLPWTHKDDLKHFKSRTMGKDLIVGRKTMETLPPLEGRRIHSISSVNGGFKTLEEAISHFKRLEIDELIIAGGAKIYESALNFCNCAEISRINGIYDCDTFMPDLRTKDGWKLIRSLEKTPNLRIEYWENECITLK
jgi:dihydrofolate reductase